MDLKVSRGVVSYERPLLEGQRLHFQASQLRQERTGLHGRLEIMVNEITFAYSVFNLERDEDRGRLVNAAYKALGPQRQPAIAVQALKYEIDTFVAECWPVYLGAMEGR